MAPKRFSEFIRPGESWSWSWGSDAVLKHPQHAAVIAATIATWSHVEFQLVSLLARVMKASARAAVALLEEQRSFDRKSRLVRKVARFELPHEEAELIEAVLIAIGPCAETRNSFAHHFWGESPLIEDGLLLASPHLQREQELYGLEMIHLHSQWADRPQPNPFDEPKDVLVYELSALKEAHASIGRAAVQLMDLNFCQTSSDVLADARRELAQKLRETPAVAAVIAQKAGKRARMEQLDVQRP